MTETIRCIVLAAILALAVLSAPDMPRCEEDATLMGTGAFIGGQWSAYVCGPAVDDSEATER